MLKSIPLTTWLRLALALAAIIGASSAQGAEPGVFDITKLGAVPNDGKDDTAAIKAAIDAATLAWIPTGGNGAKNSPVFEV